MVIKMIYDVYHGNIDIHNTDKRNNWTDNNNSDVINNDDEKNVIV